VLGDAQILGQVRTAYRQASEAGAVGPMLHRVFDAALHTGKRVQSETALVGGRNSVGSEAAHHASRRLGPLARRRCVVIGCGKTGMRAARQLVKLGAVDIVLINRSQDKANKLATELWGRSAPFSALHRELAAADVGIIATSADIPPVRAASLKFCRDMAKTSDRELLLIDLSMPRNIEADVVGLEGVSLVDLDTLEPPVHAAEALRQAAVPAAEVIVDDELQELASWLAESVARDAIGPLRDALAELCRREVAFAANADVAERAAERIVAKLLARPMTVLRSASERGETLAAYTAALHDLFVEPTPRHEPASPAPVRARAS
jgi:glutamyl-tRNA reductase